MKPATTQNEWALASRVASSAGSVFEFGCGGSSVAFVRAGIKCHSVDTNKDWIQKVQTQVGNLPLFTSAFIDLGPVKEWGYPIRPVSGKNYVQQVPDEAKLVFIDGRYRVACGLYTFLHCKQAQVLIHDFTRSHYHILLQFFHIAEQVESMALLVPKQDGNRETAASLLEGYFQDPR